MTAFIPTFATPKRWEMASFLFSGICIVYTLRVCMSVAIVKMKEELEWSVTDKGNILSSFYWGYTLGQVPASRIAQKYGAKWLFGLSVAIPSLLTLLVPVAAHHSVGMTLFLRVLIGFFESATFPALFYFFPVWVPLAEKTFMIPFIVSGMYVGDIIGFSVSGALANSNFYINDKFYGGWQSIFYVFGLIGLAWFPLWCYAAHESPHVHPYITKEEIHLIHEGKEIPLEDMEDDEKDEEEMRLSKTLEPTTATSIATTNASSDPSTIATVVDSSGATATSSKSIRAGTTVPTTPVKPSELATILESDQTTDDIELGITTSTTNTIPAIPKAKQLTRQNSANNETSSSKKDIAHTCHFQAYSKTMFAEKMHHYSRIELAQRTPWKHFVTHPTAQALLGCSFVFGWIGFTLLSEMPSFFTDALDFDLETAGILCVFPYAALFLATLAFGRLFDRLQHAHDWSVDAVRKTAMFLSFVCCATALVIAGYLNEQYAAYALIITTQIFYAAAQVGLGCAWTDIAPLYSSSLNSLGNMLAALAGILGPIIVSAFLTTWPGRAGWQAAFWLTFALSGAAMIVWMLFIKAEIVPVLNTPIKLASD